ncbi:MAG TPA: hypothetical protein VG432_05740 [Gemmatimonadaceae bacterium]|nr:hypothetical protein [Gemmatimonadaceae bacterium]
MHRSNSTSMKASLTAATVALVTLLAACGGSATPAPAPAPVNPSGVTTNTTAPWPVKTREHLDLWLHGFAMLQQDTTRVPFFRRGYRDAMVVEKNRRGVTTLLDQNRDRLVTRFAVNRNLVGAQFVALYFGSWDDLQKGIALFLQAQGDVGRARDPQQQAVIAFFAASFSSQADRDWLELFATSLADERDKFYHEYWVNEQRRRGPVLAAVDSLWQKTYRPKLQTYLSRTQQETGDFILSLPLDGEGRTISGGKRENLIALTFPDTPAQAIDAIYVFTHEAIGALAGTVIADNITPAERREGVADRMASAAAVRGGAMLLQRAAPELADGYARYYLRAAGVPATSGDPQAALAAAFPLDARVRDAISSQIASVYAGI